MTILSANAVTQFQREAQALNTGVEKLAIFDRNRPSPHLRGA